ncbi:MAG TPA: SPOR domain-containing protein [Candidatus Krumholzibacteria bacterium]|nr:SPOR domain-containing protein [Candidatus Krumholzibacteria bacterium]
MTGAIRGGAGVVQRLEELLPHLGLDAEQLLVQPSEPPVHLHESHLQTWSYAPEFTPLVQQLLQLRRPGRCLSVALGVSPDASATGSYAAVQLAIGFSQHGLSTVIVDADFERPGLSGLLADPHQEGLVDMARFGRSCRALLAEPVPGGPRLLGMGSFPLIAPSPFAGDAWLGIVHRIALHTEVALFVAPLDVEEELNPLLRHVEQVLYLPGAKNWDRTEAEVERLRRSSARVASVVLCSAPSPANLRRVESPQQAPAPSPSLEPLPPLTPMGVESFGSRERILPRLEPLGEEHVPELPATLPEFDAVSAAEPPPAFAIDREEPAREPLPPMREEAFAAEMQATETPRPLSFPQPPAWDDLPPLRGDVTRSIEEERQLRRELRLGETEFSYSEGGRYSRLPLYLFFVLVLGIGGFLGWALWTQRDINRRAADIRSSMPSETGQGTQEAPAEPADTGIDDAAASKPRAGTEQATESSQPPQSSGGEATRPPPTTGGDGKPAAEPGSTTGNAAPGTGSALPTPAGGTQKTPETTPKLVTPEPAPTPPQPVKPPPMPTTPVAGGTSFTVHVASYGKIENANQHIASLGRHGFEARAVRTDLGSKGIFFRVYVGNYKSKAAAEEARVAILKLPESAFAQVRRVTEP